MSKPRKRYPTKHVNSPDYGLAYHLKVVGLLPEDHRPFWEHKLRQAIKKVAHQRRKIKRPEATAEDRHKMRLLSRNLNRVYRDLIAHGCWTLSLLFAGSRFANRPGAVPDSD